MQEVLPACVLFVVEMLSLVIKEAFRVFKGLLSSFVNEFHHWYRSFSLLHALGRVLADRQCPKNLPLLDPYEKVSDTVIRVLGLNPGSHTLVSVIWPWAIFIKFS